MKASQDQLIAKSLTCLRSSLEALAVLDSGKLKAILHQACTGSTCRFGCIAKLSVDIKAFLDELSRVFFTKENVRAKESWWLSTFYRF